MLTPPSLDITRLSCLESRTTLCAVSYIHPSFLIRVLVCVEKTTSLHEKIDTTLLDSMKNGLPMGLTGIPQR